MKRIVFPVLAILLVFLVFSVLPVAAQEPIFYNKLIFKISGLSFYINVTYIFRNPAPSVDNNTISFILEPYNSTHLNVTSVMVYQIYKYKYRRTSSWFMEYDPYGYIIMEYNGSTVPTFIRETYSRNCTLLDNETSRILSAQFNSNSMIDVKVSYSGSVRIVDSMLCPNSNSGNNDYTGLAVMGGSSSRLEPYYFALAYLPMLSLVIAGTYYFVKKRSY